MQKSSGMKEQKVIKSKLIASQYLLLYSILFIVFLLIYTVVAFFVIKALFPDNQGLLQYLLQSSLEFILWLIVCVELWKHSRFGRALCTFIGMLSLYAIYYVVILFQYDFTQRIDVVIRSIYLVFFICKCITTMLFISKLYQYPLSYIWKEEKSSSISTEKQDEEVIQQVMEHHNSQLQQRKSRLKINRRAMHNLRRFSILLLMLLYGSLLIFYFLIFFIQMIFASNQIGMEFVQRYVLLATLFSAMVWSLTAIFLFLNKKYAKISIYIASALELARIVFTIQNTIDAFKTQNYGVSSLILLIVIEFIRYFLLIQFSKNLLQDPFIKAYWKNEKINSNT